MSHRQIPAPRSPESAGPRPRRSEARAAAASGDSSAQPAVGGWHPWEWASELVGTFVQLLAGFAIVAVLSSDRSPVRIAPSVPRLLAIGASFGLLAALVAISPPGRRSGAHLNPAVTLGFWLRGHVHTHDLLGYIAGQVVGALGAAALFVELLGSWAHDVDDAVTRPRPGLGAAAAIGIEAGLTAALLFVVFNLVSSSRTARWTPAVVVGVLAGLVWAGAPYTGASLNPARSLGPAAVSSHWAHLWVYFVGPPLGALLAAGLFAVFLPERRTLTAKLFHDERYPSTLRTELPARAAERPAGR